MKTSLSGTAHKTRNNEDGLLGIPLFVLKDNIGACHSLIKEKKRSTNDLTNLVVCRGDMKYLSKIFIDIKVRLIKENRANKRSGKKIKYEIEQFLSNLKGNLDLDTKKRCYKSFKKNAHHDTEIIISDLKIFFFFNNRNKENIKTESKIL